MQKQRERSLINLNKSSKNTYLTGKDCASGGKPADPGWSFLSAEAQIPS